MRLISDLEMSRVAGAGIIEVVPGNRPIGSNYEEPGGDYSQFTLNTDTMEAMNEGVSISQISYNGKQISSLPAIMCAIAVAKARRSPTYTNVAIAASLCGDAFQDYISAVDWKQLLDYVHYPMAGHVD